MGAKFQTYKVGPVSAQNLAVLSKISCNRQGGDYDWWDLLKRGRFWPSFGMTDLPGNLDVLEGAQDVYPRVCQHDPGLCGILNGELCLAILASNPSNAS